MSCELARSVTTVAEPLMFETYLRSRIWGGDGLGRHLGKRVAPDDTVGEAWEISTLPEHVSRVAGGSLDGELLSALWTDARFDLAGIAVAQELAMEERAGSLARSSRWTNTESEAVADEFPWLVKWLDCRGSLSVQVHPKDSMARSVLGHPYGKSEAWVVVHVGPNARVSTGLRMGLARDELEKHLAEGTVEQCLHTYTPREGDCILSPAGTVHTARDIIVAEIQQPSDATFRLFDWNRLDEAGKMRTLHHELGLQAIDWGQGPIRPVVPQPLAVHGSGVRGETLLHSHWVRFERYLIERLWTSPHRGEMTVWMVLKGDAELFDCARGSCRKLPRGSTILVPAAAGELHWAPQRTRRSCKLLCTRLPTADS